MDGGLSNLFDDEPVWSLLWTLEHKGMTRHPFDEDLDPAEEEDSPYRRIQDYAGWTRTTWFTAEDVYRRLQERVPAMKACWLGRFGEPEQARMLLDRPAGYHRLVSTLSRDVARLSRTRRVRRGLVELERLGHAGRPPVGR